MASIRRFHRFSIDALIALALAFVAQTAHAQSYTCPVSQQTFANTSAVGTTTGTIQSFAVPAGVGQVTIDAAGAQGGAGGNGGGLGAEVVATVTITPGQTLCMVVGVQGGNVGNGPAGGGGARSSTPLRAAPAPATWQRSPLLIC